MDILEGLRTMAGYYRWMNEKLYALCATLSDEERKRDRQAFFRSRRSLSAGSAILTDGG